MKSTHLIISLLLPLSAQASHCWDEETLDQVKKNQSIVIVGEVLKKDKSSDGRGNVKLRARLVKTLKGKVKVKEIDGYTMEYGLENTKAVYEVGHEYIFPVKLEKDSKEKSGYELVTQIQGCELFRLK